MNTFEVLAHSSDVVVMADTASSTCTYANLVASGLNVTVFSGDGAAVSVGELPWREVKLKRIGGQRQVIPCPKLRGFGAVGKASAVRVSSGTSAVTHFPALAWGEYACLTGCDHFRAVLDLEHPTAVMGDDARIIVFGVEGGVSEVDALSVGEGSDSAATYLASSGKAGMGLTVAETLRECFRAIEASRGEPLHPANADVVQMTGFSNRPVVGDTMTATTTGRRFITAPAPCPALGLGNHFCLLPTEEVLRMLGV